MKTYVFLIIILFATSCNRAPKEAEDTQNIAPKTESVAVKEKDTIDMYLQAPPEELPPIQLLKKHQLTEEDLYMDYDGGNQLAEYFLIELIDEETFTKNKPLEVNMLSKDSSAIHKENGAIILPCKKGEINFVDNLAEGDNFKEYTYIGQINPLNAYLIRGVYWEDWNYFLVDKSTCTTIQTFINVPYLSADGKHIVSIDFDHIEGSTFIDLYEVTDDKYIEPMVGMYVKKWIPINTGESVYWGNDNYLYVPVIHNSDYWAAEGNYNGIDQYIRLKPLAS